MADLNCAHEEVSSIWVESDDFDIEEYGHWELATTRTTVDIDTFRYQCTKCKKIMFYSGGAEKLFNESV